jgi:hypothetical protein
MRWWAQRVGGERSALLALIGLALIACLMGLATPPAGGVHRGAGQQGLDVLRVACTSALAVTLVLLPGLVVRPHLRRPLMLGFVPLPGLALLAGTGALSWVLAGHVAPRATCAAIVLAVLAGLLVLVARGAEPLLEHDERWALLIVGCVIGVAVGRSLWSLGPVGEFAAHTVDRTLEVGDRPDSRVPFEVVRLIAHHASPFGAFSDSLFSPYNFSARGPLSGIASAPVVLLAGGRPPGGEHVARWTPFDAQGFMAYRLAMMTLASTSLLAVWTLARRLGGNGAARLGLLLAATTPFVVHEVWFTWPKLLASALVLLAAVTLIDQRPLAAGLLVGVATLVHPLALFSVPVLALLALWPLVGARLRRPRLRPALLVLAGTAVWLIAWRIFNGSHYVQDEFLDYLTRAGRTRWLSGQLAEAIGGHPPAVTAGDWLSDRFVSVGNTLVPLRIFLFSRHDASVNAISTTCVPFCAGHSPGVVTFFLQYWTALPFGIGIAFFPLLLHSLWRAAKAWPWPVIETVVIPFVVFAIYWGDASTGLLREGLQVWVLTLLVVVALQQRRDGFAWLRSTPIRAILAARAVEVALLAVVPTIATRHRLLDEHFALTDALALVLVCAGTGALGAAVWREQPSRALRPARRVGALGRAGAR